MSEDIEEKTADDAENIIPKEIEEDMKEAYLNYAMSSIIGRALPDIRDGLKPVHRRILYAMHDMGMAHNKPFRKSARIVGEVLGKYHPHGDSAVYDSMVRMVQDFALRYPLIDGQGNFGSIDGDNAAAMRYTEARMKNVGEELLKDIEKKTVTFRDNFDNSLKEPTVLPSAFPNLLVNGSTGIAVGMATNIPPHNMSEICDAVIMTIKKPDVDASDLMKVVKGPDFPTGGMILGETGIKNAYHYGRGKVKVRAKIEIEETQKRRALIVEEIPYQVNKSLLLEQIADLVKEKKVLGIDDLRDESDKKGMRVVIELKKDANEEVIKNQLFKYTNLQVTFGIINLAIVNNEPKILSLKGMISHYIKHRKIIVTRRTQFDLEKAEEKAHILEGLIIALNDIDAAIELIKKAGSAQDAREGLMKKYSITEKQATAILDMKLQRLTSLEQDKIRDEHSKLMELIKSLKEILASEQRIMDIIVNELEDLKQRYGDGRRTQIVQGLESDEDIDIEDLIDKEEMVITITNSGYIKRIALSTYKQQKRGGKGIIATGTKAEDEVNDVFVANTHDYILFFTDKGTVQWKKVYQLPEASRVAKGTSIANLLELDKDTNISSYIPISEFKEDHYLVMVTKQGIVKKTNLSAYSKPRKGGIIAINLTDGDELIDVLLTDGNRQILIATANGMAVKFNEADVRAVGRNSIGVRGIKLKGDDGVIGAVIAREHLSLLTVTENGYGKRTKIRDYRLINRGGSGVINIITNDRNGKVVSIKEVDDDNDILFISRHGIAIRIPAKDVSVIGRNTQGMRLMKLKSEDDKVVGATKIVSEKEEEQALVRGEAEKKEKIEEIENKLEQESTDLVNDMDFVDKD
ncbi:DNA gyrase subunit A [Candidatus Woesearchaeota archaeon]|nr:DNA gyrase subunit A [Candidatus Woesearchaeota archaeon]